MTDRPSSRTVRGVAVPPILYGTAWKEEATEPLVAAAIAAGFRGIDTANQRKHYHEEGVGRGLAPALAAGRIRRDELFLQTKFTFRDGQDHRLPYDPGASIAEQVAQSFRSSLAHLGVDHLDSLVLHGPSTQDGLAAADREAWQAMEAVAAAGGTRLLGISNASARQVRELLKLARVAPAFVQNRCYADTGWDRAVREVCAGEGMIYQGFSLLTANRQVVAGTAVAAMARRHGRTPAQILLRFAQQLGMLPLTGTRDPVHMQHDLALADFTLDADEVATLTG
jgi:diketogulonate reductase-like aldo/keto reductase